MKSLTKFNWLWAFLLTASLFLGCATVISPKPKQIPQLNCEHVVALTDILLYKQTIETKEQPDILKASYVILGWTCKAENIALIDIVVDMMYYQPVSNDKDVLICAELNLSFKSVLLPDKNMPDLEYTKMKIIKLKPCTEEDQW